MKTNNIGKAHIGEGIYTLADVSKILDLPKYRLNYILRAYWNARFARDNPKYSWGEKVHSINFYTLIEFYVFFKLKKLDISTSKIIEAHEFLSNELETQFPFARTELLTDGKSIFFRPDVESIVATNGKRQYEIKSIIENFCKNIDFGDTNLPKRLWPNGRGSSVVVDPSHQFGLPSIQGTNVRIEAVYNFYRAGESVGKIARLYNIKEKEVVDAIKYFEAA